MANKKIKRISVNAFETIMRNTYNPTTTVEWNGVEIIINKTLSLKEMMKFVNSVVTSCFEKDSNKYLPEIKDFAIRVQILEKYSNFTMPKNVETQYDLVYQTNAVETVLSHIDSCQFHEICDAITRKIDNTAQSNIEAVNKQIAEAYSSIEELTSQFTELFSGVSEADIKAVTEAISNTKLDEEKLVRAFATQVTNKNGDE